MKLKTMEDINPWHILGLSPNASLNEIKSAYRRLLKEVHPDTSSKSPRYNLEHIKWAYNSILSKTTPLLYDTTIESSQPENYTQVQNITEDGIFLFYDVSMQDAFHGRTINLSLPDREDFCPNCQGKGKISGPGEKICTNCQGKGYINIAWGDEVMKILCKECSGIGKLNLPICPRCLGRGRIVFTKNVAITLPKGIKSGTILKVPNFMQKDGKVIEKEPFFIEVKINFPSNWTLNGLDIYAKTDIDIWTSLIGGEIELQTPSETIKCQIPPLTSPDKKIILHGMGWRDNHKRGDMYIIPSIIYPTHPPSREVTEKLKSISEMWPISPVAMLVYDK